MDADEVDPNEARDGLRRVVGVVFALLFLAGIGTPALVAFLVGGHFEAARESVLAEKRQPTAFPDAPSDLGQSLQDWPRAFEAWWNDAFGLRTRLIRLHNLARFAIFGVTPGPSVLLGRDPTGEPWLFVSLPFAVDDYRGVLPFDENELRWWKSFLEQRRDWLAESGCRYLFVVAPNKSSIYPEFMPPELTRVNDQTRVDQLVAYLRENSTVEVLDLRPALRAAKTRRYDPVPPGSWLYFPLGTHWTSFGAWIGHVELMRALGEHFPGLWPTPLTRYRVTTATSGGDTWATRFHMDDVLQQRFPVLKYLGPPEVTSQAEEKGVVVYESAGGGPVGVLLRDSFSTQLAPHLAPHFSHLTLAWNQVLGPEFTLQVVEKARPDVVIEEVVERYLAGTLPPMLPSTPKFR